MGIDWASLVSTWAPFLLLIAVWLVLSRRNGIQAKAPSGRSMIELYELQLEETKRQVVVLERIATALEARAKM